MILFFVIKQNNIQTM